MKYFELDEEGASKLFKAVTKVITTKNFIKIENLNILNNKEN